MGFRAEEAARVGPPLASILRDFETVFIHLVELDDVERAVGGTSSGVA